MDTECAFSGMVLCSVHVGLLSTYSYSKAVQIAAYFLPSSEYRINFI